jgi:hypothetical protein
MTRVSTTLRLPVPEPRPTFDGYDLDALSLEFDAAGEGIGWRLELGLGLDIFWALPTDWYDRLRLVHVDSAVSFVDEPSQIEDPYLITLRALRWSGENLGVVRAEGGNRILVAAEVSIDAGVFAVEARMLCPDGKLRLYHCRTVLHDD